MGDGAVMEPLSPIRARHGSYDDRNLVSWRFQYDTDNDRPVADFYATAAFLIHLLIFVSVGLVGLERVDGDGAQAVMRVELDRNLETLGLGLFISYGLAFLLWHLQVSLLTKNPSLGRFVAPLCVFILMIVAYVDKENGLGTFLLFTWVPLTAYAYKFITPERIDNSMGMIKIASEVMSSFTALSWLLFAFSIVYGIVFFIWTCFMSAYCVMDQGGAVFMFALSMIWTTQVAYNILFTTLSGITAQWYYGPETDTVKSLNRAVGANVGSVILGSVLSFVLQPLRSVFLPLTEMGPKCSGVENIFKSAIELIDRALNHFNTYSFAVVAMYGDTYLESAKRSMTTFRHNKRWYDKVVATDLSAYFLATSSLVTGSVMGLLAGSMSNKTHKLLTTNHSEVSWWAFMAFTSTYCLVSLSSAPLYACITTLFVCWSEDNTLEQLNERHPSVAERLAGIASKSMGRGQMFAEDDSAQGDDPYELRVGGGLR